ncbi:MAG: GNAT family N-acetyltransferase, partial [Planktomarina sp.]
MAAQTDVDRAKAIAFRAQFFRAGKAADDADDWDAFCRHVMIVETNSHDIVGYFRVSLFGTGAQATTGYTARFFDLDPLCHFQGPVMELGRFCIAPDQNDPDVLRMAWAEITRLVDCHDVAFLFGCTSFQGTDIDSIEGAFYTLAQKYLAPTWWAPAPKGQVGFKLAEARSTPKSQLPALLRSYLSLGGQVGHYAVIDPDLDTTVVFTGLEV